jgi:hypothetical protein
MHLRAAAAARNQLLLLSVSHRVGVAAQMRVRQQLRKAGAVASAQSRKSRKASPYVRPASQSSRHIKLSPHAKRSSEAPTFSVPGA